MTAKSRKKASKGRFNILLMRSQGEVLNLAVSPVILVIGFLFAIVFVVVSVNIMNRYFALYLDHRDLLVAYDETAEELSRLQSLYTYQASVADDYTNLMQALNRADPQHDPNEEAANTAETPAASEGAGAEASGPEAPAGTGETALTDPVPPPQLPQTLDEWAALLPAIASPVEQRLDVERLRVAGGRFSFALINDNGGRAAQGNLLMLFAVETPDGQTHLVASPDFDLSSTEPNFDMGPGYNIRAGKTVDGRIELPQGGVVKSMMAAAKSRTGNIVMKKLLPVEE